MSKQLVLRKIEHLQKELLSLKETVEMLGITDESTWQEKFWVICQLKYGMDYTTVFNSGKNEPIVIIRQIYAYFLHKNNFLSDKEIAVLVNRERSTISYTRKIVKIAIQIKDANFMRVYKHFKHLAQ